MSDELLVRYCSPTLAGLKTGSLFLVSFDSKEQMREDLRHLNRRLSPKGFRILPVKQTGTQALLYFYRPSALQKDLKKQDVLQLLSELGYTALSPDRCIAALCEKFQRSQEFPHEIGLFLSYPAEDVRGFIENKAANYKCRGLWKVYGDADKAQKTFCRFHRCTDAYERQWARGKSIEQLIVAVAP